MDIRARYHGIPLYGWYIGGGTMLGTSYILWKRHKAKLAAAAAASGQGSGSASSLAGVSPDMSAPIPGWAGLQAALGALGGSSPSGNLVGYDTYGTPVYSPPGTGTPPPGTDPIPPPPTTPPPGPTGPADPMPAPPQPVPTQAPPAPVVSAGPPPPPEPPQDSYYVGQVVNPNSGERVVQSLLSRVYGWLNLTNLGGIYQGAGSPQGIGGLSYGGSYLGYAAQTPNPGAEVAAHGNFGSGGLALLPGGGYTETNQLGQSYQFGG